MTSTDVTSTDVIVIGGGISGLAAAYRLTRAGKRVTLLEASGQLGGLGTFFERDGQTYERFYHCVMPSDEHLLPLIEELGLADTLTWTPTTRGMVWEGERYAFNTALDLLKFTPLKLWERLRFGAVSVALRTLGTLQGGAEHLDGVRTEDWLRALYGKTIWERLFSPMFGGKFGAAFGDVPALYIWQRLGRESNVATRGYPDGGYQAIIAALRDAIVDGGGTVRLDAPVAGLTSDADGAVVTCADGTRIEADWALSTLPLPTLRAVAPDLDVPNPDLPYQGVVNVLFFLRKGLDGHYWAPVLHSGTEFDGVIEMSAMNGTRDGEHLAYAMHYCGRDSELFGRPDAEIAAAWTEQLVATYPDRITADDVIEARVFKAPFVEPIYAAGYGARKPAARIPGSRVVLATTAQVYPEVTAWNSSTGLANTVVDEILGYQRTITLTEKDSAVV